MGTGEEGWMKEVDVMVRTLCIVCGRSTTQGSRCVDHRLGRGDLDSAAYRRLRAEVRRGDHGPCVRCGATGEGKEGVLTVEHHHPRMGSGTIEAGWSVLCLSCNSRGGAELGANRV